MSTLKEDFEMNKDKSYSRAEVIAGLIKIAQAAGTVVAVGSVAIWVLTTGLPFLAGLGVPITIGTLAAGTRAIQQSWRSMTQKEKDETIATLKKFYSGYFHETNRNFYHKQS